MCENSWKVTCFIFPISANSRIELNKPAVVVGTIAVRWPVVASVAGSRAGRRTD